MGKLIPFVFEGTKNVVKRTKKGQFGFSERQQQLINSGNGTACEQALTGEGGRGGGRVQLGMGFCSLKFWFDQIKLC